MGCAESRENSLDPENMRINHQIKKDGRIFLSEIKLLLLGTGESGKSTLAKQMRILHSSGFTTEELASMKPAVFNNCVQSMKSIIEFVKSESIPLQEKNMKLYELFDYRNSMDYGTLSFEVSQAIKELWQDPGIQLAYSRRNEYQLVDGAAYCFENIDRFSESDYIPTPSDILRVRARSTGIIETTFRVHDYIFRMVDVGGQRSERKKWIHCFQDVTAVIFCAALNEYDMKLFEDKRVNRMEESLELFQEIVNSKWFIKSSMILFLNKYDLFKEKITRVNLNVLFEDFTGGFDETAAIEFIEEKFLSLVKLSTKKVFVHITCATDTFQVNVVFDAARETIVSQMMEKMGY